MFSFFHKQHDAYVSVPYRFITTRAASVVASLGCPVSGTSERSSRPHLSRYTRRCRLDLIDGHALFRSREICSTGRPTEVPASLEVTIREIATETSAQTE